MIPRIASAEPADSSLRAAAARGDSGGKAELGPLGVMPQLELQLREPLLKDRSALQGTSAAA